MQIDSGDLLLFERPFGSAFFSRRILTNSSRFSMSDFNTMSSGTQEASHVVAQQLSRKRTDRYLTVSLAVHSLISLSTKQPATGHSSLNTSDAARDTINLNKNKL